MIASVTAAHPQNTPTITTETLGIALEGYPYPYPVKSLSFEIEGQPVRMAYMDVAPAGAANGQTVLLLHGKNFYGNSWARVIGVLTQAGYRVVVPDQIGFGKSSKPDIDYSFDMLAANTAKLLETLGVSQAVVIGHSTGGMLAVRFARTYPDRVTRLVLEDPIGLEDYRRTVPPQTTETLYKAEMEQTPEKISAFYARYFAHPRPELYQPYADIASCVLQSGEYPRWAKASALTYQMIYRQPVRSEYNLLKPSVLLIVGEQDRTAVMRNYADPETQKTMGNIPKLAEAAGKDIPHCKVVIVPDCGHVPHMEQPERFDRELLDFLK
ncbi:MAG: alpha/beta hydrolase [Capsulimonas sp.]|uniref:alpha/beta fold hydrolase n=1 Tax=Capsulimonas sp. TaxID=2494211 RepID=UPI0032637179